MTVDYYEFTDLFQACSSIQGLLNNDDIKGHIWLWRNCIPEASGRFKKVGPARPQPLGTIVLEALARELQLLLTMDSTLKVR